MSILSVSPHCVACENRTHWVELLIVDEYNRPFDNVTGHLIDSEGTKYPIKLTGSPIFVSELSAGRIQIELESKSWLQESQQRTPFVLSQGENSSYIVQSGDSLSKIASQHGMSLDSLLTLNPQYKDNPDLIIVGDEVVLNSQAETDPINEWIQQNPTGYQQQPRKLLNVTTGDFLLPDQAQDLPERHHAKKADTESLIVDQSYLLIVRGFDYKTLRLGVFFDGTGNNSINHTQGMETLKDWLTNVCSDPAEVQAELERCRLGQLPMNDQYSIEGSYANDITNIGKLVSMYVPQFHLSQLHISKSYIEGIGTKADESDNKIDGAFSISDTSIKVRVDETCQNTILDDAKNFLAEQPKVEGYTKIEIDVFGFSRGAAAARHFSNIIDQKDDHLLAQSFASSQDIKLKLGFDWANREDCRITFIGLFDTVESSLQDTQLGLAPDIADRVVHLVANDEVRGNFPLTRITDDAAGTKIAPNFTEVIMPGAHSDIGGGYYSRYSLPDADATPVLTEYLLLRTFISNTRDMTQPHSDGQAYRNALSYVKNMVHQGWAVRAVKKNSDAPLQAGEIGLKERVQILNNSKNINVDIYLNRVVEGELSRIALRLMVEAARSEKVPIREWDNTLTSLITSSLVKLERNISIDLAQLEEQWQSRACETGQVVNLAQELDEQTYRSLRYFYIHHSDHRNDFVDGLVNYANDTYFDTSAEPIRKMLPNTPGKTS